MCLWALKAIKNLKADKVFIDKQSSKDAARSQLTAMREFVREGDTVVVTEYARLARSVRDLLNIVDELSAKGVQLVSQKESFDTTTPQRKLMLTVFAGLAEFEREMILERQREGIRIAKAEGRYKGRKPIGYDKKTFKKDCEKWIKGEQTAVATMKKLDMKPNRFYRYAQKYGFKKGYNNDR